MIYDIRKALMDAIEEGMPYHEGTIEEVGAAADLALEVIGKRYNLWAVLAFMGNLAYTHPTDSGLSVSDIVGKAREVHIDDL